MGYASSPVSTAARAQLRALWARLGTEAGTIEQAVQRVQSGLVKDAARGFGKRADRAMDAIVQLMPVPPLIRDRRGGAWRFLRVSGADPLPQVEVAAVLLNAGRPGFMIGGFGLSVSAHALGRLLDRSMFRADPVAAVLEAHDALMALDPEEGRRLFALPRFTLPAAGGAFLMRSDTSGPDPVVVACSWVDADQFFAEQEAHAAAWALITQPAALSA